MSTGILTNYNISEPKPIWFTSERYDYCEPYVTGSAHKKAVQKGSFLIRLFQFLIA